VTAVTPRVTRRGTALDWVKFDAALARDGSCDPVDKALYAAIASFVDSDTRESPDTSSMNPDRLPDDIPTRRRLAECIGKSVDTVDRSTKRLETKGLLRVHRQADPDNPRRMLPSEYELLDHHIWDERAAERVARRRTRAEAAAASSREGGSRTGAATPGRMDTATPGRTGAAVKEREVKEEIEPETAPSARSAPDAGGSTSGSRDRAAGGSAAPAHTRQRLTTGQKQAVQRVRDLLPREFDRALPARTPRAVADAVLAALAEGTPAARTPEQLVRYRVMARWNTFWAPKFFAGEVDSPIGVLRALLAPAGRDHPRCDERVDVDTGEPCMACRMRAADRAAAVLPAPRASRPADPARREDPPTATAGRPGTAALRECACGNPLILSTGEGACAQCRAAVPTP